MLVNMTVVEMNAETSTRALKIRGRLIKIGVAVALVLVAVIIGALAGTRRLNRGF
jgi:hypothetical protein